MAGMKNETVIFETVGGNTVEFVYRTSEYGYWTCNGCKEAVGHAPVSAANEHARVCRAR
ncbi:hypothetical protein OHA25_31920 [Nonomuraea sp. NBC_00507]|uniref:hypothetical protein n=1 Tax=Nonomuraea sp. NBC_00507 TaxID=2976002 RepID=UPI002E17D1FD